MYISDRDGRPQMYIRWMDTGQTAKITSLQFPPGAPEWSPDGKSIAFVSMTPTSGPTLGTVPSAPLGAKWADSAKVYNTLIYRFNGIGYLPHASSQLFVVPADGGTPKQLTKGEHPLGGIGGFSGAAPVWTPDGKYILVSANRRDDYEYNPQDTEVYQFSVTDGSVKALTDRRGPDNSPAISPDGKYIAYTGFDDHFQGYQDTYLYIMNRDGSGSHVVSSKLDQSVGSPVWANDSRGVYVIYDEQGDSKAGFFALDGTFKTLTNHLGSIGTAYSAGASFSLAGNGNFTIAYTTPTEPGNIAVGNVANGATKVITNVDEGLFAQKRPGQVEEIWYNSSIDQRKIQGWIIKPPDFDPSKKYPLILEIHGGPFADYGDRFDIEKQIMAAHGYVV
ncbi:MAG: S9 family peptidase, partial [Bryobacteraceae bacterium]